MAEWKDKPTKREQDERDLLFLKSAEKVLSRRLASQTTEGLHFRH